MDARGPVYVSMIQYGADILGTVHSAYIHKLPFSGATLNKIRYGPPLVYPTILFMLRFCI
jgi:hypothetical protein